MRFRLVMTMAFFALLIGCSGEQRVDIGYLINKQAYLIEDRAGEFLIRIDYIKVLSVDGKPRLDHSEMVLVSKTAITRDPALNLGDLIWVDGTRLRPITAAPIITVPAR